jgi:hypothetical protein
MKYDIEQRVFLIKKYYELKEICLVKRCFKAEYPKIGIPTYSTIKDIVSYFKKYGSVKHVTPIPKKNRSKKRKSPKRPGKTNYRIPQFVHQKSGQCDRCFTLMIYT